MSGDWVMVLGGGGVRVVLFGELVLGWLMGMWSPILVCAVDEMGWAT